MLKGKGQEREQREEEGGILPCFPMKHWWLCNTFSPSRGCGLQGGQSRLISFCYDSFYGSPPEGPAPFSYAGFLSLEELWVGHYVSTRDTRGKMTVGTYLTPLICKCVGTAGRGPGGVTVNQ